MPANDDMAGSARMLGRLSRLIEMFEEREVRDSGLTHLTLRFMESILARGDARQEELARSLLVHKASATRAVKALIEGGFVEREPDPGDRRAYVVRATAKGRRLGGRIRDASRKVGAVLARGLGAANRSAIAALLEQMHESLLERVPRRRAAP